MTFSKKRWAKHSSVRAKTEKARQTAGASPALAKPKTFSLREAYPYPVCHRQIPAWNSRDQLELSPVKLDQEGCKW